jgi:hypothetical protein
MEIVSVIVAFKRSSSGKMSNPKLEFLLHEKISIEMLINVIIMFFLILMLLQIFHKENYNFYFFTIFN